MRASSDQKAPLRRRRAQLPDQFRFPVRHHHARLVKQVSGSADVASPQLEREQLSTASARERARYAFWAFSEKEAPIGFKPVARSGTEPRDDVLPDRVARTGPPSVRCHGQGAPRASPVKFASAT